VKKAIPVDEIRSNMAWSQSRVAELCQSGTLEQCDDCFMTKHYSNGEVTVVWKADLCQHSAVCARGLPKVFNPTRRPWIELEHATTDQITALVAKCPSGALSLEPKKD
jgi:uncharacterized Fe-S cluster protein YjdI